MGQVNVFLNLFNNLRIIGREKFFKNEFIIKRINIYYLYISMLKLIFLLYNLR